MASLAIPSVHLRLLTLLALLLAPHPGNSSYESEESPPPNSLPVRRIPLNDLPGRAKAEYHVVIGYGTPAQNLTVGFDIGAGGAMLLQCKPCGTACDVPSFDPSQSSSTGRVPCGSPDCPLKSCSGPSCTASTVAKNGAVLSSITVLKDTLTLSPSTPTTMDNIRANCLEMGARTTDSSSGILDLSQDIHSLASRAPSSPETVAFSYCLPSIIGGRGFLSIGAPRPERNVTYTTLRSNVALPNTYLVRLDGLGLSDGGTDIPISAGDALIALRTSFTYLKPETYASLRKHFKAQMSRYPVAPPMGLLDTCYNLTGFRQILVPTVTLRFAGGASLDLDIMQTIYCGLNEGPFDVCCLAFAAPAWDFPPGVAVVIGSLVQETTEVVYDVPGEKVWFVPDRCPSRLIPL